MIAGRSLVELGNCRHTHGALQAGCDRSHPVLGRARGDCDGACHLWVEAEVAIISNTTSVMSGYFRDFPVEHPSLAARADCFAVKGGTAISYAICRVCRLISSCSCRSRRERSLSAAMKRVEEAIPTEVRGVQVQRSIVWKAITRLVVHVDQAMIEVEPPPCESRCSVQVSECEKS